MGVHKRSSIPFITELDSVIHHLAEQPVAMSALIDHGAGEEVEFSRHLVAHDPLVAAVRGDKQLRNWRRAWRVDLIETPYPDGRDLLSSM